MKVIKRSLFIIVTIILLIVGIYVYARYIEPSRLTLNKIDVYSSKEINELKIAFFADTHFGSMYAPENIERIVNMINEEEVDLVVFGGDFFDEYKIDEDILDLDYFSKQLSKINSKYGKYAIWGNHDYGGGAEFLYEDMMVNGDFIVLRNQSVLIDEINVNIMGIDDFLLGKYSQFEEKTVDGKVNLLLTHAPDVIDYSVDTNGIDLILAGHSHGGQIAVPFLTEKFLPTGAKKYSKGIYNLDNDSSTRLFVTKGIGLTQLPFRFLNTPEIAIITMK